MINLNKDGQIEKVVAVAVVLVLLYLLLHKKPTPVVTHVIGNARPVCDTAQRFYGLPTPEQCANFCATCYLDGAPSIFPAVGRLSLPPVADAGNVAPTPIDIPECAAATSDAHGICAQNVKPPEKMLMDYCTEVYKLCTHGDFPCQLCDNAPSSPACQPYCSVSL